jgi:hypothetical protein
LSGSLAATAGKHRNNSTGSIRHVPSEHREPDKRPDLSARNMLLFAMPVASAHCCNVIPVLVSMGVRRVPVEMVRHVAAKLVDGGLKPLSRN